jgi:hypothetical protein
VTPIEFKISNRSIGPASPTYIIAEIGVNHDGRVERGLELIAAAAEAGVDAVKFQWFEADRLVGDPTAVAAYQRRAQVKDQRAMLRSLEIDAPGMERLIGATHGAGLDAVVTVFSVELVSLAKSLPWDAWKTASPDLVHRPLLAALAEDGRPMLVSTGYSGPIAGSRKRPSHSSTASAPIQHRKPKRHSGRFGALPKRPGVRLAIAITPRWRPPAASRSRRARRSSRSI